MCGLLLIAGGLDQVDNGDARAAYETFDRARAIGEQFADRDVVVSAFSAAAKRSSRWATSLAAGRATTKPSRPHDLLRHPPESRDG